MKNSLSTDSSSSRRTDIKTNHNLRTVCLVFRALPGNRNGAYVHTEDVELNVLRVGKQKRRRRSRRAVSPDVIECDSVLRDDNVIYTLLFSGPFFPIFIRLGCCCDDGALFYSA